MKAAPESAKKIGRLGGVLARFWIAISVISVPLAGWSLFNVGTFFGFTLSYVIAVLVIGHGLFLLSQRISIHSGAPFVPLSFRKIYWVLAGAFFLPIIFSSISLMAQSSESLIQYLKSLSHLIFFFVFLGTLLVVASTEKCITVFFITFLLVSLLVSLIAFYQIYSLLILHVPVLFKFNINSVVAQSESNFLGFPRIQSVFLEPGWFAHFNTMALIIFAKWLRPKLKSIGTSVKIFAYFSACLVLIATITTLSAGSFLVIIATTLFSRIIEGERILKIGIQILFGCLVLFVLSQAPMPGDLPNPIATMLERFYGLAVGHWIPGESAATRLNEIQLALKMAVQSRFIGIGYGQSSAYLISSTQIGTLGISSYYLAILAELGLIGILSIPSVLLWLNHKLFILSKIVPRHTNRGYLIATARCLLFADCIFLHFFGNFTSIKYFLTLWLVITILSIKPRPLKQVCS